MTGDSPFYNMDISDEAEKTSEELQAEIFFGSIRPSREDILEEGEKKNKETREKMMLWLQLITTIIAALSLLVALLLR